MLTGLELPHHGTPTTMIRGQHTPLHSKNAIEGRSECSADNSPAEIAFEALKIFVSIGKLFPGVVENVFHFGCPITHVDGECSTVLTS
jgi:hypothetical protein